ncbi:MAG: diaminopimelate decarboxylase [Tissierellaceae bacterium]|nr:diaminopimelate decarboxylase [Tissierellaceae bacterium]
MKSNLIKDLMDKYNNSFYIYDEIIISRQINSLIKNFPQFEFLYSIKTNPFTPIVRFAASKGFGADAASALEVKISNKAGIPYEKILYSTPGKTRKDIEDTIDKAIIIADSYNELYLINEVAKEKGIDVKVGLRINPNFSMDGDKGISSKFGVDQDTLLNQQNFTNNLSNIEIVGIHVHLQSQILDYKKLYRYYENVFKLAEYCKDELKWDIEFINLGGGLGIQYSIKNDIPLDVSKLGNECSDLIQSYKDKLNVRLIIETGRYVVCEAGQYVTRIADIKESMDVKYLIVEKGLNGFLRPSIAELLDSYMPDEDILKASEPLFTSKDAFEFSILDVDKSSFEKVVIAGSLCTATDIMAKDILLPKAKIGDLIVVSKAGSYSYSLSPLFFASHSLPLQFYLDKNGNILEN